MSGANSGIYTVQNGQILDPNGTPYNARGINIYDDQMGDASKILSDFPGLNFVRVAVHSYDDPSHYQDFINTMTQHGVVVELEDHTGISAPAYTGSKLAQESTWYANLAAAYKANPNVWFGSLNEPADNNGSVSAQHAATYNAIRGAGNNSPVMLDLVGGGNPGTMGLGGPLVPNTYANMHNIVWDMHQYDWISGYSTNVNHIQQTLDGNIATQQQIHSADGTVPVIVGEYGNSTNGDSIDPGGNQLIQAVQTDAHTSGNVAWGWWPGGSGDQLTDGNGNLSPYGHEVATTIQQAAASQPTPTPTPAPTPDPTPTPAPTPQPTPNPTPGPSDLDSELLSLINGDRTAAGHAPLTLSPELEQAAQFHTYDMLEQGYFGHTDPAGNTPAGRIEAAGYQASTEAENIAFRSDTNGLGEDDVQALHQQLMASPQHAATLLSDNVSEVGFGLAQGTYQGATVDMLTEDLAQPDNGGTTGGDTGSGTPAPSPAPTPTPTPAPSPEPTPTPTPDPTPVPTPNPTPVPPDGGNGDSTGSGSSGGTTGGTTDQTPPPSDGSGAPNPVPQPSPTPTPGGDGTGTGMGHGQHGHQGQHGGFGSEFWHALQGLDHRLDITLAACGGGSQSPAAANASWTDFSQRFSGGASAVLSQFQQTVAELTHHSANP